MLNRERFLLVVSAPSGGGKTTLCKKLIDSIPDMKYSVSYTTRPPRSNETNGEDYYFVSDKNFREMIKKNAFAESALVYGNYYGTTFRSIKNAFDRGKDLVLDIDIQGAIKIRKKFKNSVLVFVTPASLQELETRLKKRKSDSPEEIEKRMRAALKEIKDLPKYDYLIINENFNSALSELKSIVVAERTKIARFKNNKSIFKKLL